MFRPRRLALLLSAITIAVVALAIMVRSTSNVDKAQARDRESAFESSASPTRPAGVPPRATGTARTPELPESAESPPVAHEVEQPLQEIAPPSLVTALERGRSVIEKAAKRCGRELRGDVKPDAELRIGLAIKVKSRVATSSDVELLDNPVSSDAFDSCLVNELADLTWSVDVDDGSMRAEYKLPLAPTTR